MLNLYHISCLFYCCVELYYDMSAVPQGHCIIINNVHFEADKMPDHYTPGNTDRLGSDVDASKLEHLYGQLLNFTVTRVDNVSLVKLRELLTWCSQSVNHTDYNGLVIALLSHGDTGDMIFTTDGYMVKVHDIAKCFTTSNCPSLSNKPKVFIIQACRGPETNHLQAISMEHLLTTSPPSHSDTEHHTPLLVTHDGPRNGSTGVITAPDESDTLYAYATLEDHTALRDCVNGSWFIQELVAVIEEHLHHMHLLDMLVLVNKRISTNYCNGTEVQVSQVTSSLRKQLFLIPPAYSNTSHHTIPTSHHSTPLLHSLPPHGEPHSKSFTYSNHSSHSPSPSHIPYPLPPNTHSPLPPNPHCPLPPNSHPHLRHQLTDPALHSSNTNNDDSTTHRSRNVSLPILIETSSTPTPSITESGHYQINTSNSNDPLNVLLVPKPHGIPKCTLSASSLHSLASSEGGSIVFSAPPSPPPPIPMEHLSVPYNVDRGSSTRSSVASCTSIISIPGMCYYN